VCSLTSKSALAHRFEIGRYQSRRSSERLLVLSGPRTFLDLLNSEVLRRGNRGQSPGRFSSRRSGRSGFTGETRASRATSLIEICFITDNFSATPDTMYTCTNFLTRGLLSLSLLGSQVRTAAMYSQQWGLSVQAVHAPLRVLVLVAEIACPSVHVLLRCTDRNENFSSSEYAQALKVIRTASEARGPEQLALHVPHRLVNCSGPRASLAVLMTFRAWARHQRCSARGSTHFRNTTLVKEVDEVHEVDEVDDRRSEASTLMVPSS